MVSSGCVDQERGPQPPQPSNPRSRNGPAVPRAIADVEPGQADSVAPSVGGRLLLARRIDQGADDIVAAVDECGQDAAGGAS